MQPVAHMPYEDREESTTQWVVIFVLISILVHAIIFLAVFLITIFVPAPKLDVPPAPPPEVTLSLQPVPVAPPPPKHVFMPTPPQANAPHKETPVESNNDTQLASHSKTDRSPDSMMPDVVSKTDHSSQLDNSPNLPPQQQKQATPTPPTPKQNQPKPPQPTPSQANPAQQHQPQPKPPEPQPPKLSPPMKAKNQVDPITGLPVLPPIEAPTLAPESTQPMVPQSVAALPAIPSNVQGRAGMAGTPTPASTATELGKYKAKVYFRVGSLWYQKVDKQIQVLPVGIIKIQYTIYYDGRVETKVLEGDTSNMQLLYAISHNSITEAAPFDPFTDSMRKQVGDSYTDYFTFSVYGQ